MNKSLKHLELFAGIGGFRQAIDLFGGDNDIATKCVGFSENDPFAVKTYKANFSTENEIELGDIELFTSSVQNLSGLPEFDLLTGGFPCQSFSMMGKQRGFNDSRGNVFHRIIDILDKKKPKFVLLENVKNLKTHDKGRTMEIIIETLKGSGYKYIYYDVFNTSNFSLAQIRNRIFIFASRVSLPSNFQFSQEKVMSSFLSINGESTILRQESVLDILEKDVGDKYYLSDKIKKTILANGSKSFISKSEINQIIARPLTATMVKMHRACQDNYYSDDFVSAKDPTEYLKKVFSKEQLQKKPIRKLTPKEALALQGFDESFFIKASKAGLSNHQLYKQAGNAVSINTVYAILYHLFIRSKLINKL